MTMLPTLLDVFAQKGYLTTVYPTKPRGTPPMRRPLSHRISTGWSAAGGDGTLNETVTGLMKLTKDRRPVLGYIPTGSTNDFSRNLSLPRGTAQMAEVACGSVPRACDLAGGRTVVHLCGGLWPVYRCVLLHAPKRQKSAGAHRLPH